MTGSRFSSSTIYLRLATPAIVLAFILLVVGVSIPRWSSLKLNVNASVYGVAPSHHVGLWQACSCGSETGNSRCQCMSNETTPESLKEVRVLMLIGLSGLLISGLISLSLLFTKQGAIMNEKTLTKLNIAIVIGSGTSTVVGIALYAAVCNESYEDLFSYVSDEPNFLKSVTAGSRLGAAFILCTVAGGVSLLVCSVLLVMDHRASALHMQTMQLLDSNPDMFMVHKQVIMRPHGRKPADVHSEHVVRDFPQDYNGEHTLQYF